MKTAQTGLTLIEACAVLAIASILLGSALPSFEGSKARRQLEGVASELAADLQFARTESVARNQGVRVSFDADESGGSCYVIHTGPAGSCACRTSAPTACEDGSTEIKTVALPSDRGVQVRANVASMLYDPVRATVTPAATLRVNGGEGAELRHVVNMLGRVRTCAAAGEMWGYRRC